MGNTFSELKPGYTKQLAEMKITRSDAITATATRLAKYYREGRYTDVSNTTGVPIAWMAASFEREASSNFNLSPAQGDPWDRKSVHVPVGRGPFKSWGAAAIDAYQIDGLEKVGAGNWSWELCCYYGEKFNGFGYRNHGIPSPYLWGGTSVQERGKYVRDGKFDPSVMDTQLGIIPMMEEMVRLEPSLDFSKESTPKPPETIPAPVPKKKPPRPINPAAGGVLAAAAALSAWISDHPFVLPIIAVGVAALLIYLHKDPAPNQSPKATEA